MRYVVYTTVKATLVNDTLFVKSKPENIFAPGLSCGTKRRKKNTRKENPTLPSNVVPGTCMYIHTLARHVFYTAVNTTIVSTRWTTSDERVCSSY